MATSLIREASAATCHNETMSQAQEKLTSAVDADIEDVIRALHEWSGETIPGDPKNKRGKRTRVLLMNAAIQAMVGHGYVDCTVEDILLEAGVSRGTFYAYFRSKKAVFAAAVENSIENRLTSTDVSDIEVRLVRDKVEASVRKFLELSGRSQGLALVMEQVAHLDPSFRTVRLLIRDSFARRIAKGIRRQQARGIADPEVDPAEAGLAIVSMMTHYSYTELAWRERRPTEEMVDLLTRFWVKGISLDETAEVKPRKA